MITKKTKEYTDSDNIIDKSFRNIETHYHTKIEKIRLKDVSKIKDASSFEDEISKYVLDFINECQENISNIENCLIKEYKEKMEELEIAFRKQANIALPNLDFEKIMQEQRKQSYETIKTSGNKIADAVIGGLCGSIQGGYLGYSLFGFGPVGIVIAGTVLGLGGMNVMSKWEEGDSQKDKKLNIETYTHNLIEKTKVEIGFTRLDITKFSSDLFKEYAQNFSSELKDAVEERQRLYDNLEQENKENQESYEEQMQIFEFLLGSINDQANSINELTA